MFFAIAAFVQFIVTLIMGTYFYRQLKNTQEAQAPQKGSYSKGEQERLCRMRAVHLSEPLSEKARPSELSQIVGQKEGIRALRAILCGAHPQHVIIYGPPGIGKTCAARLMLEEAKKSEGTPFRENAPFVEVDATCVRFDERSIADPLIGSVHDPIYQGAGPLGMSGIPQPREGAVTRAHGGILFLDEIGEMPPIQMNKLLKVLEDRKVRLESAYYDPDDRKTPGYIHDIFKNGLPADFRLVAATTRSPEEIPPALRSRCMEIYFRALEPSELAQIAQEAARRLGCTIGEEDAFLAGSAGSCARDTVNIVQMAVSAAEAEHRTGISRRDIEWVMECCGLAPRCARESFTGEICGRVNGLAVWGTQQGTVLRIDASVLPGAGTLRLTGAVDREEIGVGSGRRLHRSGMAQDAARKAEAVLHRMGLLKGDKDVFVDFPGGTPVDGPSAGLAVFMAAYSALRDLPVSAKIAMTGEIGIREDILPVGGVGRKVEAAERAGCTKVLIPRGNWQEMYRQKKIGVYPVGNIEEALEAVFSMKGAEEGQRLQPAAGATHTAAQPVEALENANRPVCDAKENDFDSFSCKKKERMAENDCKAVKDMVY